MSWTWGIHPVEALLDESPDRVQELWIVQSRRPGPARVRVRDRAQAANVRFRMVTDAQLRGAVGDVNHQGVAARVTEFEYADAEPLLEAEGPGLIVVLDEVQDPHNLGAVLRSARAFGARAVVIPKHRSASVTPAAIRVAAGAAETLPVARVTNLARFVEAARDHGWWSYATVVEGGEPLDRMPMADRAVLILGSERRGVRPGLLDVCDAKLTLPIDGVESLNVSVAAGIFVWEWAKMVAAEGPEST